MAKTITARIDDTIEKELKKLSTISGLSESEIVRQSLEVFINLQMPKNQKQKKFIGLGMFESKVIDLATNKKHMKGFGE